MNNQTLSRLGWIAVAFTYFLMVWGNMVSSTGSGLACPDWPLCHGSLTPALSFPVIMEWGHRLIAAASSLLILFVLVRLLSSGTKSHSALRRSGISLLILLGLQILLGGATVLVGLSAAINTIHLLVANVVFAGLITVATVVQNAGSPAVPTPDPKVRRLALAASAGVVVQLALGALVRHTHSGLACPNFPSCGDSFFPIPLGFGTALAFLHRWWGVALIGVFVQIYLGSNRTSPELRKPALLALTLVLFQVGLGVMTVLSGLSVHAAATHAACGYALWGTTFYMAVRAGGFRFIWTPGRCSPEP